jgi:hypothetical protein
MATSVMLRNSTPISIRSFALDKQPYDPLVDFTHITLIGSAPLRGNGQPGGAYQTIGDVEAQARKTDGSTSTPDAAPAGQRPSATFRASL